MKESLTKKLGPLPVWAWAVIALVLVWYYRNKMSAGSSAYTTTSTTPADATQTQAPVTLGPGESVYDPNTGQLLGGGSSNTDYSSLLRGITNAIKAGQTHGGNSGTGGGGGGGGGTSGGAGPGGTTNPATTGSGTKSRPAVGSHIGKDIVAPYGHFKPAPKKGYRRVGTGSGGWLYVPRKPSKPKPPPKRSGHH